MTVRTVVDWVRSLWADIAARDDALSVDAECTCGEECPVHEAGIA